MKAEIDKAGVLFIKPETELECYALKKWSEDKGLGSNIIVQTELEEK